MTNEERRAAEIRSIMKSVAPKAEEKKAAKKPAKKEEEKK